MKTNFRSVVSDRTGFLLVVAALVVMVTVGFFALQHSNNLHREGIRKAGQPLVRAVAAIEAKKLTNPASGEVLLQRVVAPTGDLNLAYLAVTKADGSILYAIGPVSPGPRAPAKEPHAWYGVLDLSLSDPPREAIEFQAPLLEEGVLVGFVRLAYFGAPANAWVDEMPFIASLLLLVCLLMLAGYLTVRYEMRSLSSLSAKLTALAQTLLPERRLEYKGTGVLDFQRHFEQFIELIQHWTEQTKNANLASQTAAHLIVYRQEKAEAVLHSVPEAIMILDEDCTPSFANSRATTLMDCKLESLIGKPLREWCTNADVHAFLVKFRNASTAPGLSAISYTPPNQPDKRIGVSVHAIVSPRDKDSLLGRLVLFRDMTSEHLARQSGAEFVSHAAHELKTPLATLAAYSENLMDYAAMSDDERVNSVNVINEEARRMAVLINNLLSISKLDAGTLQLSRSRVKVHELLQDAYDNILPIATQNGISLSLKMPQDLGSARLDKDLLRIAIDNVISNGVKYSNTGGEVVVSAQILENDELQVTVQDKGIGISPQDCARIFDKHYRVGSGQATSRPGHGLGLYLARQIIELHKGRIVVESELGKGTAFTINLNAQAMNLEGSSDR